MYKKLKTILLPVVFVIAFSCGRAPTTIGVGGEAACKYVDATSLKAKVSLEVPYAEQYPNYCGPDSLAMIAKYYGYDTDQSKIGDDIVGDKGVGADDLAQKALDMGLTASIESCGINSLMEKLSAGSPVIVRVLNNIGDNGHFMVVTGYDMDKEKIYLNDPANPHNEEMTFEDFEDIWNITTLAPDNNSNDMMIVISSPKA